MLYKEIEQLNKPVSSLIFGTSSLSSESGYKTRLLRKERLKIFTLLDLAFEEGYNAFDTAAVYMLGESEKILGEWITVNGIREKVIIISKGSHPNYFFLPSIIYGKARLNKKAIDKDLSHSLKRLKTDYIDIYMPHRDNEAISIMEVMNAYNPHVSSGKIRVLGCSNWHHRRIEEANKYALKNGLEPFKVSSPHYSLFNWSKPPWKGTISIAGKENCQALNWYSTQKIPVFAWSPLAGGARHTLLSSQNGPYSTQRNKKLGQELVTLSLETGFSVESLVLSWMSAQTSPVIFPIIKSTNPENIKANALSQTNKPINDVLEKLTELSRL